jgi:hypothetical protein
MTRSEVEADHKTVRDYIVIVRRMQNAQRLNPPEGCETTIETRNATGVTYRISDFRPRDLIISYWR